MANHNFFKALLKYGRFDEYHFFLANSAHRRLFESGHGPFLESVCASHKVRLFDRLDLLRQAREFDYTVFHQSDHITSFSSLCHFRNQVGSFPVTAFIHSLSYQRFMSTYLHMMLGGVTSRDSLICSSTSGKKALENCFQQIAGTLSRNGPVIPMEVIPLGLDGESFYPLDRVGCRNELQLGEQEVIGLCFGRFSDYDKMDLFPVLQAFERISRKKASWRLILAGAVHSESYLKTLRIWTKALGISQNVTFLTNLSQEEKVALYRSADFFISLSDNPQETFGITLLEAMACGLPLMVSDFDGYRDIVTDEVGKRIPTTWGDFEPLGMMAPLMDEVTYHRYLAQSVCVDVEHLADGLKFFFSNPYRCREMGEAARQRFLKLYDYPSVIEKLEALWLTLKKDFDSAPNASHRDPLNMNVFQCFSHYVTQTLASSMKIKLTPLGKSLLESETEYPLFPEMARLIDHDHMMAIMRQTMTPCSVGEIGRVLKRSEWNDRYVILWMLKHGLLQFIPEND